MIEHILLSSNSFKEHLTSVEVNENLKHGIIRSGFRGNCTVLPISDGGAGTISILERLKTTQRHTEIVRGPENEAIKAEYITFFEQGTLTAFIEFSSAAGIGLSKHREALKATSYGVGELIKHAINHKCKKIFIGLGDSATTDCGMGILQALGVKFYDSQGKIINYFQSIAIKEIYGIDNSDVRQRLIEQNVKISCFCDGMSSLGGVDGSWMRAKQKGANNAEVQELKNGIIHFIDVILNHTGISLKYMPQSGCAGGTAGGLHSLLGAELTLGSNSILDLLDFDTILGSHDLVVTGEGIIDQTTFTHKAPHEISIRAKRLSKPVIAVASQIKCSPLTLRENGIDYALRTELQNYDFQEVKANKMGQKLLQETGMMIGALVRLLS